jgi:outer membrane biosynthesis protein TonB
LLHDDDHVPAKTSRVPLIVGGLILAAVAAFFFLRGSSKPPPAAGSGTGDATASQATPSAGAGAGPSEAKVEPPKTELPKAETPTAEPPKTTPSADVPKTESEKADIPPAAAAPSPVAPVPVKDTHRPAPAATAHPKPAARPAYQQKKPSPAKAAAPETDIATAADTSAAPSGNCEAQLPAMRKAAARGDAKAKADLGLVYYAGRCVPRDLPTAYHWYALALRTAPDSPQISAQLEAIWKQMSPAERQLALKTQ